VAKLTKRVVDGLKPATRDVFAWDGELRGFGVRVKPSGAASYIVQYRNAHGRTRRLAIGKVGTLTPEGARKLAKRRLGEVAEGADPSADRHAAREAMTVAEVCDWYLKEAEASRLIGRRGQPIKASTLAMDRSRIERHVKPLIGGRPVAALSTADLERMQSRIAEGSTASEKPKGRGGRTTGGGAVAGRTLGMLSTIFEHAVRARRIAANPAKGTRRVQSRRRLGRLSLEQLAALGKELAADGENPTAVATIRLMALTGFRRQEALGIRHDWLLENGGVLFPDTKSGSQARPIGKAALALLKKQRGATDGEWLFPADRGDGHFIGVRKALGRIAARAGFACTPHLLRHTFSSVAGDLGYSELTIAGLLGHASKGVTAGYVHLDATLTAAADRVASVIAAALEGRKASVLRMTTARRTK
jgi:integrase